MMSIGSARAAEDDLTPRTRMSKLSMTAFPTVLDTPAGSFQLGNEFANFSRHRVKEEEDIVAEDQVQSPALFFTRSHDPRDLRERGGR